MTSTQTQQSQGTPQGTSGTSQPLGSGTGWQAQVMTNGSVQITHPDAQQLCRQYDQGKVNDTEYARQLMNLQGQHLFDFSITPQQLARIVAQVPGQTGSAAGTTGTTQEREFAGVTSGTSESQPTARSGT